jgi:ribosomal protein S18 acetylase RimI-like enzyme
MRGLAEWGAGLGASAVYLQVAEENAAALAMYDRLGFVTHHTYHYRIAPE